MYFIMKFQLWPALYPSRRRQSFYLPLSSLCWSAVVLALFVGNGRRKKVFVQRKVLSFIQQFNISPRLMWYAHEDIHNRYHESYVCLCASHNRDMILRQMHTCDVRICGKYKICIIRLNGPIYNAKPKSGSKISHFALFECGMFLFFFSHSFWQ